MSKDWAAAFAKAQAEFPAIHKDKTAKIKTKAGGEFSYSYADLPTILEQVNPILKENGLAIGQAVVSDNGSVGVETRVYHVSGHVEVFGPLFLPGGDDARSAGSAVTYARRYSLCAALGIATDEDDDGQAASAPQRSRTEAPNESDPYCPACFHINGERVALWDNSAKDKGPFWRCKNKAGECAGTSEDGKWQWSGWHKSWEESRNEWLEQNEGADGLSSEEPPEQSPAEWLKVRVAKFSKWTADQRTEAFNAVLDEAGIRGEDGGYELTMENVPVILAGMQATYDVEFPPNPDEAPF